MVCEDALEEQRGDGGVELVGREVEEPAGGVPQGPDVVQQQVLDLDEGLDVGQRGVVGVAGMALAEARAQDAEEGLGLGDVADVLGGQGEGLLLVEVPVHDLVAVQRGDVGGQKGKGGGEAGDGGVLEGLAQAAG